MSATKTYTIELRVDFEEESKHDVVTEVFRGKAREILTTVFMLKDSKREPQITFSTGDLFEKNSDIEIIEPETVGN